MKVTNQIIKVNRIILHNLDLIGKDYQINPLYEKRIKKIDNETYSIELTVRLSHMDNHPFPVNFETSFYAQFHFDDFPDDKSIINYLNVNAVQFVFPLMRSSINNVFTAALLPPLILPVIDVRVFKEMSD